MQVVSNGAIGDVLVDEEELTAVAGCAAVECHEVWVADEGEDRHLVLELLHTPPTVLVQPLDRHYPTVSQNS